MKPMKKLVCLLLCAVMLLGLPIGVTAEEQEETAPDSAAQASREPAEQLTEENPTEQIPEEDPELRFQREHPIVEPPAPGGEGASLMAGSGSVTVTVDLPGSAPQGGRVYVSLMQAAEIDAQGKVTKAPLSHYGKNLTVDVGSSSLSFTVENLPEGEYICRVQPYLSAPGVPNENLYFNGDGTLAANEYVAKGFTLAEGASVSKTLSVPEARYSISGTVTFTSPVQTKDTLSINAYRSGSSSSRQVRCEIPLTAGADSVPFSLRMLTPDRFYLQFRVSDYSYYAVDNTLNRDYSLRHYFDLNRGSVSGLSVNGDGLLNGEGDGSVSVSMSVTLPEAVTGNKSYILAAFEAGDDYIETSRQVSAKAGDISIGTAENSGLSLESGRAYYFGYVDASNYGGWSGEQYPGMRYLGENGVTSIAGEARLFTFTSDGTVSIREPACWKITGSVDRGEYFLDESVAAFVVAEFPDGQRWGARAVFQPNEKTASYTIHVPKTQSGSVTFSAAFADRLNRLNPDSSSWVYPNKSYPALAGNVTVDTIKMKSARLVSGTVRLPDGVTAPTEGFAVSVSENSSYSSGSGSVVVIPAGQSSVSFSTPIFAEGTVTLYANQVSPMDGVMNAMCKDVAGDSAISIQMESARTISGTVRLPDGIANAGVSMEIYGNGDSRSWYSYCSIREGGGSTADYSLPVPDGTVLNSLYLQVRGSSDQKILGSSIYVGSDWTAGGERGSDLTVTEDHTVDFNLLPAILLSGTFVDENGAPLTMGASSCNLYYGTEPSGYTSVRMTVDEQGNWSAGLPRELAGELYLWASLSRSDEGNVLSGTYYYTSQTAAATKTDQAETLTVPAEGLSGIRIPVKTGYRITGQVRLPEGAVVALDSGYSRVSLSLNARAQNGGKQYSGTCRVENGSRVFPYSILVPRESDTYTVQYTGTNWRSEYGTTNVLFDEMQTGSQSVTVNGADTTGPDFTLNLSKAVVRGTVYRPEGTDGSINLDITVRMTNGDVFKTRTYIYSDENSAAYSIAIPASETDDSYTMEYSFWNGKQVTGYLTADDVSTRKEDAAQFSLSDSTVHNFTPASNPALICGRIYLPEKAKEGFGVTVFSDNGVRSEGYFYADSGTILSDALGRYINYKLYSDSAYDGALFFLSVVVDDRNGVVDETPYYVDKSGGLTDDYASSKAFTCTTDTALVQDITLRAWDDGTEACPLQSGHGLRFTQEETLTWHYVYPGECQSLTLSFSDRGDCETYVINESDPSGSEASESQRQGAYGEVFVDSGSFAVELPTYSGFDFSCFGFAIESITPAEDAVPDRAGYAAVFSKMGDDPGKILEQVQNEKTLTAIVVGQDGQKTNAVAALYDADGKFISMSSVELTTSPQGQRVDFTFPEAANADQVRLFLCDGEWSPLAEHLTIGGAA